jgi:hypothetical protein
MSTPITEAHIDLALQIAEALARSGNVAAAELIADSEAAAVQTAMLREYGNLSASNESLAKERDQLRAELAATEDTKT